MADPAVASDERTISFGPFRLLPAQRLLLEGEKPVRLGSRALDILIALVEHPGEVVGKDELMARAWPRTVVEEGNLKVQISALRRTLGGGNRYLVNFPGRGYSLIAPLVVADGPPQFPPHALATKQAHNLPAALIRMIGRADAVSTLAERLPRQRLITIVGPGGIGKTSVALAVAEALTSTYEHGVWLIDLAPLADPWLVPSALASVLGLEIRSDNPLPGLVPLLRERQMLLVLDNCEHVIEAAAALAAAVLRGAAGVHILATSREPLRADGERGYRLSPLASPPASARLTAAEALGFPAVQLFVERAAANMGNFQLADADSPIVAEICRKLDGLPLAIEFAAARVDAFGVRGLAAHLDERLPLLTSGRRTALPRHRTLSAALDWSYQLLTEAEQRVFRRLTIFAGGFTLHAAGAVAADATRPESEIIDQAAELVAKSLVAADVGDAEPRLRLLDTTRAYALTKLTESGDVHPLGRRHAEYYRELLETTAQDKPARDDWSADFVPDIDNIRAALTWAFAPEGDGSIAVALAAASAPIWLEMALLTECHGWARKALDLLDAADRETRREMGLQNALGLSLLHIEGKSTEAGAALTRACDLAQSVGDPDHRLRALAGLALLSLRFGDFRGALAFARQAEAVAKTLADPVALSTLDSILSLALLHAGEYAEALSHAQRAYRCITPDVRHAHIGRSGMDYPIAARCIAARTLWMQGLLDQSAEAIRNLLADAQAGGNPVSVCLVLAWWGCPISLRLGDLETAERRIALLKEHSEKHALNNFYTWCIGFEGELCAKRGDIASAKRLLRTCLEQLRVQSKAQTLYILSNLAEVLAMDGRLDESLAAADEALQRSERSAAFWWTPEASRIKGEILLLADRADTVAAEDHFCRSLDLARQQGNLFYELRAAMSLARLHRAQGRIGEARDLLAAVYDRFTEGFKTAYLQSAKQLLDELRRIGAEPPEAVSRNERPRSLETRSS